MDEPYPILFLDALFVNIRDYGSIRHKAVYLALLNLSLRWTRPLANLTAVINQFIIMYEDRVPITWYSQLNKNSDRPDSIGFKNEDSLYIYLTLPQYFAVPRMRLVSSYL